MGFSDEETAVIYRFVSAILHIGNIDFVDLDNGEASAVTPGNDSCANAAALLQVQVSCSVNFRESRWRFRVYRDTQPMRRLLVVTPLSFRFGLLILLCSWWRQFAWSTDLVFNHCIHW